MTDVEYIGNVQVSKQWAEDFVKKSKKLALEYETVWSKQYGKVFVFLMKRRDMKYEYALVKISVVDTEEGQMAVVNVMMFDKKTILEIANVVEGGKDAGDQ